MKTAGIVLVIVCVLSACGVLPRKESQNPSPGILGPQRDPSVSMRLQTFGNCLEADAYLQTNFRRHVQESLDQQAYWLQSDESDHGPVATGGRAEAATGSASQPASQGPREYTKTNTQVTGVDEPDIMKTNGRHIYSISGSQVQIAAAWPASDLRKIKSLAFDGQPLGLMLTEANSLIVIYQPWLQGSSDDAGRTLPMPELGLAPWIGPGYPDHQVTRLALYDVTQAAQPLLKREFTFFGSYQSLRRQGTKLRLIQSEHSLPLPEGLKAHVGLGTIDGRGIELAEFRKRRAELEAANELVLGQLTLVSYLETIQRQRPSIRFDDPLFTPQPDCQKVFAESQMSEPGLSKLTTIDLASETVSQVTLLAPSNMIYASDSSLYLAHSYRSWWWGWAVDQGSKTFIHKFATQDNSPNELDYLGSGVVDGFVLNSFAMDEYKDHLRVAVTDDRHIERIDGPSGRPIFTTINRVLVLSLRERRLEVIGQTPDLAPGEQIYAVRFIADQGYVVTFRQVDPLYTLDLRNPEAPQVVGELKIPGFSNYLHPISPTHLLGIGQDADPSSGQVLGLKISLFDVSDPALPRETHSHTVRGTAWSWSEAQYDHKAFTYFDAQGLFALPVGGYRRSTTASNWWEAYFSELLVFRIDPNAGIELRGSIEMNDLYRGQPTNWMHWWGGAQVRRSIFADDVVYAISDVGIRAVYQGDLQSPLGSLSFYP